MDSGAYIGIICGILAFIVLKTACIVALWRRRNRKSRLLLNSTASTASLNNASELLSYIEKWEIRCDDIKIIKKPDGTDWELGAGAFGKVVKGLRGGVQEVAIKMLFNSDSRTQEAFLREISMLKFASRDRNIVQFYGVSLQRTGLWLITEHMEGGDLRHALTMEGEDRVTWWNKGKVIACDVARGLAFLHSNKVIHRDLKSKNILLDKSGMAKITDVGMAKLMSEAYYTQDQSFGTFSWAAPEVLLGQKCSEKVDCYSLGVTCWEIATGMMPIRGQMTSPTEEECPPEVRELIHDLMQQDAHARPSAAEAYRRLRACRPCPQLGPLPCDLAETPDPPLKAPSKGRQRGSLTWDTAERDIDSAEEANGAQTGQATLLQLAEGASNQVTLMENSYATLCVPERVMPDSYVPKEEAVLLQLANGASNKLDAIDSDDAIAAAPASGSSGKKMTFKPPRLPLTAAQAAAIAAEDGLLPPAPAGNDNNV